MVKLVRACGQLKDSEATDLLKRHIDYIDPEIRYRILLALNASGYRTSDSESLVMMDRLIGEVEQAARKYGITAEQLTNALVEKGMQGLNLHGAKKKEEFVLETMGIEKGVDPRKAARSKRLREIAAEGTGGDDTITKQLNEFDFWDE